MSGESLSVSQGTLPMRDAVRVLQFSATWARKHKYKLSRQELEAFRHGANMPLVGGMMGGMLMGGVTYLWNTVRKASIGFWRPMIMGFCLGSVSFHTRGVTSTAGVILRSPTVLGDAARAELSRPHGRAVPEGEFKDHGSVLGEGIEVGREFTWERSKDESNRDESQANDQSEYGNHRRVGTADHYSGGSNYSAGDSIGSTHEQGSRDNTQHGGQYDFAPESRSSAGDSTDMLDDTMPTVAKRRAVLGTRTWDDIRQMQRDQHGS